MNMMFVAIAHVALVAAVTARPSGPLPKKVDDPVFGFGAGRANAVDSGAEAYILHSLPSRRVTVAQGAYFPRLELLDNDELLATFKTGAGHVGKGGKASMSISKDGGLRWSVPTTVFDIPGADDGVIASGQLRDGTVIFGAVSYRWKGHKYTHEEFHADTYVIRSTDRGRTWSPPLKVDSNPFTWAYPFGNILELSDGVLLMSMHGGYLPRSFRIIDGGNAATKERHRYENEMKKPEPERGYFTWLVRSRDHGKTWGDWSLIARGYSESNIMQLPDGRLMVATRRSVMGAVGLPDEGSLQLCPFPTITVTTGLHFNALPTTANIRQRFSVFTMEKS